MSYNITLNSSNVLQGTTNNTYQYQFLNGSFDIPEGSEVCISQITIPYSWVNVSAALGNNTFGYAIPAGATPTYSYFSISLPDGFYTISDLNNALISAFKTNNHYWYSSANGTFMYPITLTTNSALYTNTVNTVTIPLNANISASFGTGAGWSKNPSWSSYPTVDGFYACLFIPQGSSNTIGNMLGFTGGSSTISPAGVNGTFYPSIPSSAGSFSQYYATTVTSNGNTLTVPPFNPPLGTQVNGVIVRCNLVHNHVTANTDVLDCFPITSTYGSNINYTPISENWIKVKKGKYNNITVYFQDQSYNPLKMLDPNVLISLLIRFP